MKRSATECSVSESDREATIIRRQWPTGGLFLRNWWWGGTTSESMFCAVRNHRQLEAEFWQTDAGSSCSLCSLLLAFFSFDFYPPSVYFHT